MTDAEKALEELDISPIAPGMFLNDLQIMKEIKRCHANATRLYKKGDIVFAIKWGGEYDIQKGLQEFLIGGVHVVWHPHHGTKVIENTLCKPLGLALEDIEGRTGKVSEYLNVIPYFQEEYFSNRKKTVYDHKGCKYYLCVNTSETTGKYYTVHRTSRQRELRMASRSTLWLNIGGSIYAIDPGGELLMGHNDFAKDQLVKLYEFYKPRKENY